jgi:hypothetical protein
LWQLSVFKENGLKTSILKDFRLEFDLVFNPPCFRLVQQTIHKLEVGQQASEQKQVFFIFKKVSNAVTKYTSLLAY